ncbi:MAG: L-histidine N(alpha)-methyltransferase [Terriglobales bacterium]
MTETVTEAAGFVAEAVLGLRGRPRTLPCRFLYDAVGSALFEAITLLPEYGLARADRQILRQHAATIAAMLPQPAGIIELGAGSARKTRPLLAAIPGGCDYAAVDISPAALRACRRALDQTPGLGKWRGYEKEFLPGLARAVAARQPGQRLTALFLGGTIGNLSRQEAEAFLRQVHTRLAPSDALLLGTDLEQDPARLLPAYDDAAGVTAAFNRNLLARLQRELGARLDPQGFAHEARWDAGERRIEMHLRALGAQEIAVPAADFVCRLADGETIWTESSYKYEARETRALGEAAGFEFLAQWRGEDWPAAETLFTRR